VAHDQVEIGHVRAGEVVVAGVPAEGRLQGYAALLEDAVEFEGVASDVVFAEQIDHELAFLALVVESDDLLEDLVVRDVVARRLADALVAFAAEAEDVDLRMRASASRATACTSSPMSPTGQVEKMSSARGWKSSMASSIALRSFFSPPNTMFPPACP
jgi:hypothetical protein